MKEMSKRSREGKSVLATTVLAALLFASGLADHAESATFSVTKTADAVDGVCDNDCSLREAVIAANLAAGHDVIVLPAGTYTLGIGGASEDNAASGDLDITDALTINGAGQELAIIDGGDIDRVLDVAPGGFGIVVELNNLTIRNGFVSDQGGGGIRNHSILTLTNVTVSDNESSLSPGGGQGGGIENNGDLTLLSSQVLGNMGFRGGGIFNSAYLTLIGSRVEQNRASYSVSSGGGVSNVGDALLVYSTVAGNNAGAGGGIRNESTAHLSVRSSTISGNVARSLNGGGVQNEGVAELVNSTISGNTAYRGGGIANFRGTTLLANVTLAANTAIAGVPADTWSGKGGGLYSSAGQVGLRNSLLAGNNAAGSPNNCLLESGATLADSGHNLDNGSSCGLSGTGDLSNTDPAIGSLADNGGPSHTIALLQGSPAIDAGAPDGCTDSGGAILVTDQRGVTRSVDGGSNGSGRCDIGAYEHGASTEPGADLAVLQSDAPDLAMLGQVVTYTVTIKNNGPASATGVLLTSTLDDGMIVYPAYPSQGSCAIVGQSVTCRLGSLGSGENVTVEVFAVPTATGDFTNVDQVWDYEFDPVLTNSIAAGVTTVQGVITAPRDLTARAMSSNRIALGWNDNSNIETGFRIERKKGDCGSADSWVQLQPAIAADAVSFIDTGLSAGTMYSYRARANIFSTLSAYSNCSSSKTGISGTPNSPTNLKATSNSSNKITLAWTDNALNGTKVKVYRTVESGASVLLAVIRSAHATSYADTTATGNDETSGYSYHLQTCNLAGCSPATATAAVPSRPSNLIVTGSTGKVVLTWEDKSTNEKIFEIWRKRGNCASASVWSRIRTTAASVRISSDTGLAAGTYSYKVRASTQSPALPHARGYSMYTACQSVTVP